MTQPTNNKIETKVIAGAVTAAVTAFILWLLESYFKTPMPAPVQDLVYVLVPAILAFAAGYFAPPTDRQTRAGR